MTVLAGVDWTAVGTIAAIAAVAVTLYTFAIQLRQQNLLAAKKVEEDYLRQVLAVSDRVHDAFRAYVERGATDVIHRGGAAHIVGPSLSEVVREYRRTLLLSLHVVREMRKRRFPRAMRNDEALADADRLAHDSMTKYEELARRLSEHPNQINGRDLEQLDGAYVADFMLRVPVSELIARMYTDKKEWKRPRPRFS